MYKYVCNRDTRRGFSLVEILVVITIIGILVTLVASVSGTLLDESRSTACSSNLRDIGQQMLLMKTQNRKRGKKAWPKQKGIRFLLELTKGGQKHGYVYGKATKVFICPGTDDVNTTDENSDSGSAYLDLNNLDSFSISYAGRNQVDFPIEKDKQKDDAILAADDNEGRPNHKFHTNYVTVGPMVDLVDIRDYIDEYPELEYITVGPDSEVEMFTKLMVDF